MKEDLSNSWKLWQECLFEDDNNSVFSQISNMVWDAAIFHLILESWQIQNRKHIGLPGLNNRLQMFINWNFFAAQATSIRRLIDSHKIRGTKSAYSLRGLINDIRKQREKLTRETFLGLQELPYDCSSASNHPDQGIWIDIGEAHKRFDKLSGRDPNHRSRADIFSETIFDELNNKLVSCSHIKDYVDKYIAHASTPESRLLDNFKEVDITLRQIWKAQQDLYQVAYFLSSSLFSRGFSPLPLEPYDLFETAGIPVIDTNRVSEYEKVWKKYRDETESWRTDAETDVYFN